MRQERGGLHLLIEQRCVAVLDAQPALGIDTLRSFSTTSGTNARFAIRSLSSSSTSSSAELGNQSWYTVTSCEV